MVGMLRCLASLLMAATAFAADPANLAELRRGFEQPPDDARMMVRWWWFGPSVTKAELEREMRMMKAGGIGGFEVQATYPLQLEGNMRYMSPEFLDALKFTGEKAKELGLRMDLTLGSGWPYGGPHITQELAAGRVRVQNGESVVRQKGEAGEGPGEGAEGLGVRAYKRAGRGGRCKDVRGTVAE